MPHDALTDRLPAYLNGTLSASEAADVRGHLEGCPDCRLALRAWEGIADAEGGLLAAVRPTRDILAAALTDIDRAEAASTPAAVAPSFGGTWRGRQIALVVLRQVRLLRPVVWGASALAIVLATYAAAVQPGNDAGALLLSYALPLIAATGVGFVADPDADPLLEIARATPTAARLIFLSRWGVLFGFDFALSLIGSVALAATNHQGVWGIAVLWMGPMALLAALSALLAVLFGPFVAAGGALALWLSRSINPADGVSLRMMNDPLWQTSPIMLCVAAVLLALALLAAERRERFSMPPA